CLVMASPPCTSPMPLDRIFQPGLSLLSRFVQLSRVVPSKSKTAPEGCGSDLASCASSGLAIGRPLMLPYWADAAFAQSKTINANQLPRKRTDSMVNSKDKQP